MKHFLPFWCAGIALIAVFPNRGLLGLLGVLLFLGSSIGLLFLYARSAARSFKSGRWGVGLVMVGGLVLVLGLFVSQRVGPYDDKAGIEKTIEVVATSTDPTYCRTRMTPRYLSQVTGTKQPFADEVCESEASASRAKAVDTSEVTIEDDHATAVVAYRGGSFDGSQLLIQLAKGGEEWKLHRLVAFRRFDRAAFDRAYRRSFLEFGSSPSSADCALAKAGRLSDSEIEQATLKDLPQVFAPIFVECDRDGAERNLVTSISAPKLDFPPATIQCASRQIGNLSDAQLARLRLSPLAYGRLLYRCGQKPLLGYLGRELKTEENLDSKVVGCVLGAFHRRPVDDAIRLSYDQTRFSALIDRCRRSEARAP